MGIDGLVFDMGGVLAFDVWEHVLGDPVEGVAAQYGLDLGEMETFGAEHWKKFEHHPLADGETPDMLEREYWQDVIRRFRLTRPPEDFITLTDRFIRPVEGMNRLLERIRSRGIPMAICSNNNEFWIRRQMDRCGLHRFFGPKTVILSCRVGKSKISPKYEMFQAVTEALGSTSESTIFIDDRFENIRRAMEYGWSGILFPREDPKGADCLERLLDRMGL